MIRACVLGDENTEFFRLSASVHWRHNQIRTLELEDGTLVSGHDAKATILHSFYQQLLGTREVCTPIDDLGSYFSGTALSSDQARSLVAPFTMTELQSILKAMLKDSAPGPDGFTPHFFHAN